MYDPLASMLGAITDGLITYSYLDAVKLTGHSCPTVSSAYLIAYKGIRELYPDNEYPVRGNIEVIVRDEKSEGVTGVISSVLSMLLGASDEGGFNGIKNYFSRKNLLVFNADIPSMVCLRRKDTQKQVLININLSVLKLKQVEPRLIQKILSKTATKDEINTFEQLWQGNVHTIFKNKDISGLIEITS